MARGKLTAELQTYVVQRLACFDSPSEIAATLRRDQGIEITPQSIECYDPTKQAGRTLKEEWRALFGATRKAFLEDTAEIGIAHRSVRLRKLDRMASAAEGKGNIVLAAALMEQAAKEMGNTYTNRRELTGKDGKDLNLTPTIIYEGMPEQPADATGK